jgi:methylated-DNA-[protein]-cysteine S-methyltransferase
MWFDAFDTKIGVLTVAADAAGLRHILFPHNKYEVPNRDVWKRDPDALSDAREQLLAYFAGERTTFTLRLAPQGTTFQLMVWHALARIPYGETRSYAQIAFRINAPTAVRAVGAANGRNPLPIVLPCHRVIGADGSLTGFGGGLPLKRFLLEHEGVGQRPPIPTRVHA